MKIWIVALLALIAWGGVGYYYYSETDREARRAYYRQAADCRSGRTNEMAGRCEEYYYRYRAGNDDRMIEAAMVGLGGPVVVLAIAGLVALRRRRSAPQAAGFSS